MTFWCGPLRSAAALQVDLNDGADESPVVVGAGLVCVVSIWYPTRGRCLVSFSLALADSVDCRSGCPASK